MNKLTMEERHARIQYTRQNYVSYRPAAEVPFDFGNAMFKLFGVLGAYFAVLSHYNQSFWWIVGGWASLRRINH